MSRHTPNAQQRSAPLTVRTKLQNVLHMYVEDVYTIQNGADERNGLTAFSVGGHDMVLN